MKIEITDRELWKTKCLNAIEAIKEFRAKEDEEYVKEWRNSKFKIGSREGKFPEPYWPVYPCFYYSGHVQIAHSLLKVLKSPGTGTVYIDDEEFAVIEDWCK